MASLFIGKNFIACSVHPDDIYACPVPLQKYFNDVVAFKLGVTVKC